MSNDRFKFRAWSKEEKKYYYDAEQTHDYFNGIMSESFGELLEDDRYIVEQCTGIKDKYGNFIFEGDLIQWVKEGEIARQGVVEFCDGDGAFSGSWQAVDYRPNGCGYFLCQHFSPAWKIIGNIHETKTKMSKWKPSKGERYYFIDQCWKLKTYTWEDDDFDNEQYEIGNVFQTYEQAKQALEKLKEHFLSLHGEKEE